MLSQLLSETNRRLVSEFSGAQLPERAIGVAGYRPDQHRLNVTVQKRKVTQCV